MSSSEFYAIKTFFPCRNSIHNFNRVELRVLTHAKNRKLINPQNLTKKILVMKLSNAN